MVFKNLLQLFYPTSCVYCQVLIPSSDVFCASCVSMIKPVVSLFLPITKKHALKIFAACAYEEPVKSLVLKKFSQNIYASKQLAQLVLNVCPHHNLEADYIISIPLHWTRYARRGYNQANVMAHVLGKQLQIPVIQVLKRVKKTKFQSRLSYDRRRENVKDVFALRRLVTRKKIEDLQGKRILLVDDLCTTGATLLSAAKILLKFKPQSISAVVACRTV